MLGETNLCCEHQLHVWGEKCMLCVWGKWTFFWPEHNSAVSQHKFVHTSINLRLRASNLCLGRQIHAVSGAKGTIWDPKHNSAASQHKFVPTSINLRLRASNSCLGKQIYAVGRWAKWAFGGPEHNSAVSQHTFVPHGIMGAQSIIRLSHSIKLFPQA